MIEVYTIKNPDKSVTIFKDKDLKEFFCTFPSYMSNKPDKRYKWIVLNCYRYSLKWHTGE